jgi:hypothetical protein
MSNVPKNSKKNCNISKKIPENIGATSQILTFSKLKSQNIINVVVKEKIQIPSGNE